MKKRIILFLLIVMGSFVAGSAAAEEPSLSIFKENYVTTGIPLNARPNWDTNDVAFQISARYKLPWVIGEKGWDMYIAYTQLSLWDVYRASNPIKSQTFMPCFYLYRQLGSGPDGVINDLMIGYEHRSNGYAGDKSRTLDFLFATYTHTFSGRFTALVTGRFGVGSIYNTFSLEMFNRYQGYCTAALCYHTRDRSFMASASATPLFMGDIPANISAEIAWRPKFTAGLYLVARYHYGYDENQLDCAVPDVFLKHMLRFGVALQPGMLSHNLCF